MLVSHVSTASSLTRFLSSFCLAWIHLCPTLLFPLSQLPAVRGFSLIGSGAMVHSPRLLCRFPIIYSLDPLLLLLRYSHGRGLKNGCPSPSSTFFSHFLHHLLQMSCFTLCPASTSAISSYISPFCISSTMSSSLSFSSTILPHILLSSCANMQKPLTFTPVCSQTAERIEFPQEELSRMRSVQKGRWCWDNYISLTYIQFPSVVSLKTPAGETGNWENLFALLSCQNLTHSLFVPSDCANMPILHCYCDNI